ncbi:hypothetical protein E5206_10820 [Arthrobacter sp. PAMC25564]|nr:hypothetical protein E5206_10820 [Arthrobacter sp. PAMC25564]
MPRPVQKAPDGPGVHGCSAGPDGYQLGNYPPRWVEWNGKFRDVVRDFWRGRPGVIAELAKRLTGSADLYHRCSVQGGAVPDYPLEVVADEPGGAIRSGSVRARWSFPCPMAGLPCPSAGIHRATTVSGQPLPILVLQRGL